MVLRPRLWISARGQQPLVRFLNSSTTSHSIFLCSSCIRLRVARSKSYSTESPPSTASSSSNANDAPKRLQEAAPNLPSLQDQRRASTTKRFSHLMDTLQSRVLTASHTLNDMTGYSSIEAIKRENEALEASLLNAHDNLFSARQAFKTTNANRAASQREVTALLARKDSWLPADLERFTELYRKDHEMESEVTAAQDALTAAEAEESRLSQRLNAGILKRYHEEQIWSDRIRRASTWGTWGLMGMNFLLFVVLQFVAEPWRRRRLVRGVVAEEREVLEQVRDELAALKASRPSGHWNNNSAGRSVALGEPGPPGAPAEALPTLRNASSDVEVPWNRFLLSPARWKAAAAELSSGRTLQMRMVDLSIVALQSAITGAAVAGSVAYYIARR